MELNELANFLKIAEYENITKAANELHVTQPHLTRQLRALELELGVTLFVREKKRLHITDEGRFLKQQAKQLLGFADKTKEQISEMGSGISGTLYIGAIETVGTVYLPQWLAGFKAEYPKVKYNLWSANSTDVIERLERGLLDVALVRAPFDSDKYDSIHVLDEEWVALMSSSHPLSDPSRDAVTFEELAGEDILVPSQRVEQFRELFYEKGLESNIVCGFAPLMNAVVMAENNFGVAILPESCQKMTDAHDVVIKRISGQISSSVYFIWRKQYELPGTSERFLSYVTNNPISKTHSSFTGEKENYRNE